MQPGMVDFRFPAVRTLLFLPKIILHAILANFLFATAHLFLWGR